MSLNVVYDNPDESLSFLKRAETIAFDASDKSQLGKCYWAMGYVYQIKREVVNSKKFYLGALKVFRALSAKDAQIKLLENIGTLSLDHGLAKSAHRFYKERYRIAQGIGNIEMISDAYYDLGLSSRGMYHYDSALIYFVSSLSHAKRAGLTKDSESEICNQIGVTCMEFGFSNSRESLIDSAMIFLGKAIELSETPVNTFHATNNIGNIFKLKMEYSEAENWLSAAHNIGAALQSKRLLIPTLNNLGMIYFYQGKYQFADSLFNQAVSANLSEGSVEEIIHGKQLNVSFDNYNEGILSIQYLDSISRKMPLSDMKSDIISRLNSEHFERKILEFRDMESTMAMELDLVEKEILKQEEKDSVMNTLMFVTFTVLGVFIILMVFYIIKGKAHIDQDDR